MAGVLEFRTLDEAIRAGFQVYDKLAGGGYLVRKATDAGYALAFVAKQTGPIPCTDH